MRSVEGSRDAYNNYNLNLWIVNDVQQCFYAFLNCELLNKFI